MPGLDELINRDDPGWPVVQHWIAEAANGVEVLPTSRMDGEQTLLFLQITTRSPLGAIAYETGGLLVDHGWLRVLGAGCERMRGSLRTWNGVSPDALPNPMDGALLVAHDVTGGFFALNGGAFGDAHSVFYFAPDSLAWEDLGLSYSALLQWAFSGDLAKFYSTVRWPGWQYDVERMTGDQGISFWPMLWAKADSLAERSRRIVPMPELWSLQRDLSQQVEDLPAGYRVRLRFDRGSQDT